MERTSESEICLLVPERHAFKRNFVNILIPKVCSCLSFLVKIQDDNLGGEVYLGRSMSMWMDGWMDPHFGPIDSPGEFHLS